MLGLALALVEANSSSCFSLIDLYMLWDAPVSAFGGERRAGGFLLRC